MAVVDGCRPSNHPMRGVPFRLHVPGSEKSSSVLVPNLLVVPGTCVAITQRRIIVPSSTKGLM